MGIIRKLLTYSFCRYADEYNSTILGPPESAFFECIRYIWSQNWSHEHSLVQLVLFVGKGMDSGLPSPSFVIILDRCMKNCGKLLALCEGSGATARPHLKTHKCANVAEIQVGGDKTKPVAVSTVAELRYFAEKGFRDVLYAVPYEPSKESAIAKVQEANPGLKLSLYADCREGMDLISSYTAKRSGSCMPVYFAVDTPGYGREGADPTSDDAVQLACDLADGTAYPNLRLEGMYSHSGNAYNSPEEARSIAARELWGMVEFCQRMAAAGARLPPARISIGSTPSFAKIAIEDLREAQKALSAIEWGSSQASKPGGVALG